MGFPRRFLRGIGQHSTAGAGRELTPLEEEMVAAATAGELVERGEGSFTLAEMQAWAEERTVRAAVLRHLLIAGGWPVDAKGVRLRGVRELVWMRLGAPRCSPSPRTYGVVTLLPRLLVSLTVYVLTWRRSH